MVETFPRFLDPDYADRDLVQTRMNNRVYELVDRHVDMTGRSRVSLRRLFGLMERDLADGALAFRFEAIHAERSGAYFAPQMIGVEPGVIAFNRTGIRARGGIFELIFSGKKPLAERVATVERSVAFVSMHEMVHHQVFMGWLPSCRSWTPRACRCLSRR